MTKEQLLSLERSCREKGEALIRKADHYKQQRLLLDVKMLRKEIEKSKTINSSNILEQNHENVSPKTN